MTRVLVLLAARNGARVLGRQLASVLGQTGVEVLVDIRDDGSTDATRELVADLAARDPRVSLRADSDPSGSAAGNFFRLVQGAQLDRVTHVAFCDQDDEWHLDKLARAAACLEATGSSGYSAATEAAWPDGRRRVQVQDGRIRRADHLFEGAGQGCTFVFTVDLFRRLQRDVAAHMALIRDLHYHDWTLYALARGAGERWYFDASPCMTYHQHADNDTGARSSSSGVARRIALIRQGWYRAQVDAVVRLLRVARPDHAPAIEWQRASTGGSGRLVRLAYVVRHGRRKPIDRAILAAATILGYL
jgi:rhamnosyltransferase